MREVVICLFVSVVVFFVLPITTLSILDSKFPYWRQDFGVYTLDIREFNTKKIIDPCEIRLLYQIHDSSFDHCFTYHRGEKILLRHDTRIIPKGEGRFGASRCTGKFTPKEIELSVFEIPPPPMPYK